MSMTCHPSAPASLLGALLAAACQPTLDRPHDADVACTRDAQCPFSWRCVGGSCRAPKTIDPSQLCTTDDDCDDGVYCNGAEGCRDGMCEDGVPPCGSAFACVISTCEEATQACSVTVAHDLCADGTYCDPAGGCIPGTRCMPEHDGAECQDGFVCTGQERCLNFHCEQGSAPVTDDLNPCTLDACMEPDGPIHLPVADGNVCPLDGVARAVCRAGTCLESTCGDGFADISGGELCDDGAANADTYAPARHCNADCSAWAPWCGDTIIQRLEHEECDDGVNHGSPTGCEPDCELPFNCGDGRTAVANGEGCDDGNHAPGDGCTPSCTLQPGWACDTVSQPARCTPGLQIAIAAGSFTMGSPATEAGRDTDEPLHDVTLTHNFSLANAEVSQEEFARVMNGWRPSHETACNACPVEQVSWYDALVFLNQLTLQEGGTPCFLLTAIRCEDAFDAGTNSLGCTGRGGIDQATVTLNGVSSIYDCTGFRLPTEAEWEYAARAGTATATYNGDLDSSHLGEEWPNPVLDPIAWFAGNSSRHSHPSGTLAPNGWGLYDVLGSVWEWCWDRGSLGDTEPVTDPEGPPAGDNRVMRGGSFSGVALFSRAACRDYDFPYNRQSYLGFRVARSLP
jgi:cysteine-rich repeat protein